MRDNERLGYERSGEAMMRFQQVERNIRRFLAGGWGD